MFQKVFYYCLLYLFIALNLACKTIFNSNSIQTPKCNNKNLSNLLENPDTITCLNLSKQKLKEIPTNIQKFHNLKVLIISHNKIDSLPPFLFTLSKLQYLDISKNNIGSIPDGIGNLINLENLVANRNNISNISGNIGKLNKLKNLDLWGNEIDELPVEISFLKHSLKRLDLRVIMINQEKQQRIKNLLPHTQIFFSESCNCK